MEDTILNIFMVVVSFLLSKDHVVFQENDEDIMVSLQDHEITLLKEMEKLKEGEHAVAFQIQEASLSNHWVTMEEDKSDVELVQANVKSIAVREELMSLKEEENRLCLKMDAVDEQRERFSTEANEPREGLLEHETSDQKGSQVRVYCTEGPRNIPINTSLEHWTSHALVLWNQRLPMSNQKSMTSQNEESSDQLCVITTYIWRTFSLISVLRFLKILLRRKSNLQRKTPRCYLITPVSKADYKTLMNFHNRCALMPSQSWQTCEFVEGFLSNILRNANSPGSVIHVEEFVGIGSLYEQWATRNGVVCDVHIPIIPPKSFSFDFELLEEPKGAEYSCRVKFVKNVSSSCDCQCRTSSLDTTDLLCLIHPKKDDCVTENQTKSLLCQGNSYLAKTLIVKWFKTFIRNAWTEMSHKYEFEVLFQKGTNLKVCFRSSQTILFNLTPVIRFKDSEVHLIPSDGLPDSHWPLSFTCYEKTLLQHITESLPDNSCHVQCLRILSFLHKQQKDLTGPCGLRSFHLKNAILYLLVNHSLSWDTEQMGCRVSDLLIFLQERLEAKTMYHVLVGNSTDMEVPAEFRFGKHVNLFLPLFSNDTLFLKAKKHLLEMRRNLPVFILEYGYERFVERNPRREI